MAKEKGRKSVDFDRDILSVEQTAAYLGIGRATFFKLLEIPESRIKDAGGKILGQWRFSRRKILEWLESGGYSPPNMVKKGEVRTKKRK